MWCGHRLPNDGWCRSASPARLRHEALHAGPGFDQRAVDGKVLAGQLAADLRQVENARKELGRDITVEQPISVLAEDGGIPHRIVRREPNEPAEHSNAGDNFSSAVSTSPRIVRKG